MRWKGKNSTISRVIAFNDVIAAAHCQSQIGPDWKIGQMVQTVCFMNTYGWDETKRDVDIPVFGGFNLGFDERNVYAVDYGSEGVREGAARIRLVEIPVAR